MISKLRRIFLAAFIFSAVSFTPAFAQSDALKSAYDEVVETAGKVSPKVSLQKVIEFLSAQVQDAKNSLALLRGLNEDQGRQRQALVRFLNEAELYLNNIDLENTEVKIAVEELKDWREQAFNPQLKKVSEFLLVFQARGVLNTAETRALKIRADLERLSDLKIIKKDKPQNLLNEANLLLVSAEDLWGKAEKMLYAEDTEDSDIRETISGVAVKIRLAYKKFLEISQLVRDSLK